SGFECLLMLAIMSQAPVMVKAVVTIIRWGLLWRWRRLANAADAAHHHGPEDEPQRGAPEDEAKTEVMPTRDAEQLVARLVQEVKEPSEDRGREHLGQGERHVPQRHVSSSRLLAIGKHVAGERPVDGVVGTVADAVEDAEDIEKSERADEAEEQDGYDNGLHGARDIDEQLAP